MNARVNDRAHPSCDEPTGGLPESPGFRSGLHRAFRRRWRRVRRTPGGRRRRYDGVVSLPRHPPGSDHDLPVTERQVRRIEEHHLADLGPEHIHFQRRHRGSAVHVWHRELQLDAVGALHHSERRQLLTCKGCTLRIHGGFPSAVAAGGASIRRACAGMTQRRSRRSWRRSGRFPRRSWRRFTPWVMTAAVPTTAAALATGAPMTPRVQLGLVGGGYQTPSLRAASSASIDAAIAWMGILPVAINWPPTGEPPTRTGPRRSSPRRGRRPCCRSPSPRQGAPHPRRPRPRRSPPPGRAARRSRPRRSR